MFRWTAVGALILLVVAGALLADPAPGLFYALRLHGLFEEYSGVELEGAPPGFQDRLKTTEGAPRLRASLSGEGMRVHGPEGETLIPPPGPGTVLPPLVAVLLAVLFRRVVLCLVAGILVGSWVLTGWALVGGVEHAAVDLVVKHSLIRTFSLYIFGFVILLSMAVGVAHANGGIRGILGWVMRFCRTARATRIGTALAGLVIFFDDYLNTIIVGNTMRALTDRFRVSREKLAYIVDSTAAPVAGIALMSTWIAYEVGTLQTPLAATGAEVEAYDLFVRTLPYRFYCIFTIGFVLMNAWTGRDYAAMLRVERRSAATGEAGGPPDPGLRHEERRQNGWNGLAPILVVLLLGGFFLWLFVPSGKPRASVWEVLKSTQSARAFCWASGAGLAVSLLLTAGQRLLSVKETGRALAVSLRAVAPALVILLLAWSIGEVCVELGTGPYLVSLLGERLTPWIVPMLLFLLSSLTAFATGSSWSTMAILLPVAVPLAYEVGGIPLLTLGAGAVLEGSIFGDHCSPISDTTVLSSTASLCPHHAHVETQIPYAL
ncbi:MAG: Na+/H+ antiporter NhaC family protein, partial [Planctomycetota bacterium]